MERLLFVCTGNVCRSPMAAAIAACLLGERGAGVEVVSAGLLGAGRSATPEAEAVMRRRGLDLSAHRSRNLEAELAAGPDLVIAMAREHARSVVDLRPDLFPCTLTLKDLVRRAEGENRRRPAEDLPGYLLRLQHGRKPSVLAGRQAEDDVADPIGQTRRAYERCAAEIEGLVRVLVDRVWPARTVTEAPDPPT